MSGAPYATVEDLALRVPWSDLAEVAAPDTREIDGAALSAWVSDSTVAEGVEQAALERAVARLEGALADASAEIDGYLAGAGATPAAQTLRTHTLNIATYRLLGGEDGGERHQIWRRSMDWLSRVASGAIELDAPSESPPTSGARFESSAPAFRGRGAFRGA